MEKDLPVSVAGHSGSVLCVGQPSAGQPLLFQNFEQGFKGLILKGGFILPEEIRRSDILLGSQDASSVRRDQSLRQTRRTNSTRKTSYTAP